MKTLAALSLLLGSFAVQAAQADPVAELDKAKEKYGQDIAKAKSDLIEQLDKASVAARNNGDKKLIDRIAAEKAEFEESGQLPTLVATIKYTATKRQAKANLEAVYKETIKKCVRSKQDEMAALLEAELLELNIDTANSIQGRIAGAYLFNGKHKCYADQGRLNQNLFVLVNENNDRVVATYEPKGSVLVVPAWKTKMLVSQKNGVLELRDPNTNAVWTKIAK